jgi:hypothetical protein
VARFLGGPSPPRGARAGILTYGLHDQVAALVKKYWNELRTGGASTLVNFGIVTGLLFTMSSPIGLLQQHIRICGHELGIGCPFIPSWDARGRAEVRWKVFAACAVR